MLRRSSLLFLLFFASCGYHIESGEKIAISVPYVQGDIEGMLTNEIVRNLSTTTQFQYTQGDGNWLLQAKILSFGDDRIGYRYDRDDVSGKRRTNVVGVENRLSLCVELSIVSCATGKCILGPKIVKADTEYDYYDPNSLKDVSFTNNLGIRQTSVGFSLGQLDSVEGAHNDAYLPLFQNLAKKIVEGLIAWECNDD